MVRLRYISQPLMNAIILYNAMNPHGFITTYCAKGVVRRTLQACRFTMERLSGPTNGKREILRGTKTTE